MVGLSVVVLQAQKKTNGAPNGFYGEIDWDRYVSHHESNSPVDPVVHFHMFFCRMHSYTMTIKSFNQSVQSFWVVETPKLYVS